MNVRIYSVSKQMLAAFAIASMILSLLPFSFASAAQVVQESPYGPNPISNVDICHNNEGNGFVLNTVSVSSSGAPQGGHENNNGAHAPDIIPPYFYLDGDNLVQYYGGKNWNGNAANQALWNNDCAAPVTDVCPNIDGPQATIPSGMEKNQAGECVAIDVCPNIDGPQATIPTGMVKNDAGQCVTPVVDQCLNIPEVQATVPTGMVRDDAGNCTTPAPKQCVVYSDTTVASEATTVTVTPHPAWVPNLPKDLGDWIWSAPDADGIVTFTKVFNVDNAPTGATLTIAVDNSYTATLNGNPMSCDGSGTGNFNPADTCSASVTQGVNTLVIAATNAGGAATSNDAGNPAGVIFELVIDGSSCSPVPPPVVLGCTDPEAINYNEDATEGNPDAEDCEYEVPQCQNLLLNGSFEEPTVTANGGQWQIFGAVANWAITLSDGLELWKGIIPAYDGVQNAELDGNNPTKISQPVATIPGATYELSFAFAARSGTGGAENNSVDATADGSLVVNASGSNTNWTVYNGTFTAADSSTDIAFQDRGAADSLGTLIDDARLCLVKRPMPNFIIDGYKYNDLDNDGALDEGEPTIEDWEFELLYDGEVVDATTTDENGYYKFEVEYGDVNLYDFEVREVLPNENSGWSQTAIYVNDGEVAAEACRMPEFVFDERDVRVVKRSENDMLVYQPTLSCLFLNHKAPNNDDTPGGGGNGRKISLEDDEPDRRVDGDSDEDNGPGRVLGEQTSVVPAGAPNAGAGGASTTSNLMVGLVLAAAPRRTRLF